MATKTREKEPRATRRRTGQRGGPDKSHAASIIKITAQTWIIPCSLLDDWDAPGSDYAPYVKHAVLDGYALTYALLGGKDDAVLVFSFRPEPSIKNLRFIAIADVFKGLAHVKGEWPGFDAYRTKEGETGPTGDPIVIERTLRKTRAFFSCTLVSKFFRVEFDYDFSKHVVSRFKYVSIGNLTETKTRKQRSHRKRDELPDPSQPPDANVNRYDALYNARISKEIFSRVDAFLKATGMRKKDVTEQALTDFMNRHESDPPGEIDSPDP